MLKQEIAKLIQNAIKESLQEKAEITLEYPKESSHGDYACNIAMQLSKKMGKSPREIAELVIKNIPKNELISTAEIAGPGFINIHLTNKAFDLELENIKKAVDENTFGKSETQNENIMIEYSQPNIAKPLGVHHLLSTIIGQSLVNIFKFRGYRVTSTNYIGDWGTQFGKLIYAYKEWGDKKVIEKNPIAELLKLYVKFHDESEKDPELDDKGRAEFKKLEEGEAENTKLWEWVVKISMDEVQNTYAKLGGIEFDNFHGESYYRDQTADVINEGKKKGLFKEGNEGALMVFFPDEKYPPYMIVKKDGATLYSTRDLPCIRDRDTQLKGGRNIYVVDVAQKLYFQQLFETAKLLGYTKNSKPIHVEFGRMSFPDGSMSTRKGKVILLDDVLDEAVKRAEQKIEDHKSELESGAKKELAKMLGIGAVKYNVLSQSRLKNYTFEWDQMLSFEGNSAPYLQYAYTRTQSLIQKAGKSISESDTAITCPEEKELVKMLARFEEVLIQTTEEYKPNTLCTYLYELAHAFSQFYNNLRIIDAEKASEKSTRITLTYLVASTLKSGLNLLGIEVPDKM
jgi:arginyl-tRNA synthetase